MTVRTGSDGYHDRGKDRVVRLLHVAQLVSKADLLVLRLPQLGALHVRYTPRDTHLSYKVFACTMTH